MTPTLGPWEADASGHGGVTVRGAGRDIATVHYNVTDVAVKDASRLFKNAQPWADARLIAAAPDLLEVVEEVEWWLRDKAHHSPEEQGILDRLSAVVEQAREG